MKKFFAALFFIILFESSAWANPWGMLQISNQINSKAAIGVLAVDGSNATYTGGSCPCTAPITTTLTNDIIVIGIKFDNTAITNPAVASVSDAAGLTWTKYSGPNVFNSGGHFTDDEIWWAVSFGILTADTITVTSTNTVANVLLMPFGVHGANLTTPFDPNVGLPAFNGTSSNVTTLTNNANTTKAATMLFTQFDTGLNSWGTLTIPSGFTSIQSIGAVTEQDYKIVSTPQSSVAETYTWTSAHPAGYILGAIQASGQ